MRTLPAWAGRLIAGVCLAAAFAAFCLPISNPDVYWHLSAARWMAEHKAFPSVDWLSSTMVGEPWTDFEWLTQVVWGAVHRAGGMTALWALKVLLFSACGALVWAILGLYGLPAAGRGLGVLAWGIGLTSLNDLRPENFSNALFLILWLGLEAWRLGRLKGVPLELQAAVVAGGFAIWANLHAGFVYGLVLIGLFAAADFLRSRSRGLFIILSAACVAPLANPYGLQVYVVPWEHLAWMNDLKTFIMEWQEPSLLNRWHWPFWGILFVSFATVIVRYWQRRDVAWEHLAALAAFGVSAGGYARTGSYFVCVAVPITGWVLGRWRSEEREPGLLAGFFAAAFLALGSFFASDIVESLSYRTTVNPRYVPARLADFLEREKELLGKRMFNPWHLGGYLGWRLNPRYRVFVDGRYIFHPWLRKVFEATREPAAFSAFLDEEFIGLVVLEQGGGTVEQSVDLKGGGKASVDRPLYLFFVPKEKWALVYWDTRFSLFVRRSAVPGEWLEGREYRWFRPDDLEAARLMVREGAAPYGGVAAEAERFILQEGEGEQSLAARYWLASLEAETPGRPSGNPPGGRKRASPSR